MKKIMVKGLALAFVGSLAMAGTAIALAIDHGTMVTMIDGNNDVYITADLSFSGVTSGYEFGYFLGNDNVFNSLNEPNRHRTEHNVLFDGGTVVDFAFKNNSISTIYRASEDLSDGAFSVTMDFYYPITGDQSQQPQLATESIYFGGVTMQWVLANQPGHSFGIQAEMSRNDGVAPVPEPATMLLFGSGLAGLAGYGRRKIRKKNK